MTCPAPLPFDEARRLARLKALAVLDTPAEPLFDALTRLASELCDMPIALVSLIDADRQWFKAKVGLSVDETPRAQAFCAHALLTPGEPFFLTYGDGVGDVDITAAIAFHRAHGRAATVTAVVPPGRFGALERQGDQVAAFVEKPAGDGGTINGGFFVLSPSVLDRIAGDATVFEQEPLKGLARDGALCAYDHRGFWQPMDTLRDRDHLQALWDGGAAPWKIW